MVTDVNSDVDIFEMIVGEKRTVDIAKRNILLIFYAPLQVVYDLHFFISADVEVFVFHGYIIASHKGDGKKQIYPRIKRARKENRTSVTRYSHSVPLIMFSLKTNHVQQRIIKFFRVGPSQVFDF